MKIALIKWLTRFDWLFLPTRRPGVERMRFSRVYVIRKDTVVNNTLIIYKNFYIFADIELKANLYVKGCLHVDGKM